jgi:hypothetical protein
MHFVDDTRHPIREGILPAGLGRLFISVSRSLFGGGAVVDVRSPPAPVCETHDCGTVDDDMGWLSLTSDADGHSVYEEDVTCMGVTPDDLDVHDADGGDLSWIGLSPVHPAGRNGAR